MPRRGMYHYFERRRDARVEDGYSEVRSLCGLTMWVAGTMGIDGFPREASDCRRCTAIGMANADLVKHWEEITEE